MELLSSLPTIAGKAKNAVFVYPPGGGRTPLAGPFQSPEAARWWIVEHLEALLTPAQRIVWAGVMERLPRMDDRDPLLTDAGLEIGLIDMVRRGWAIDKIARYIPKAHTRYWDRTEPKVTPTRTLELLPPREPGE